MDEDMELSMVFLVFKGERRPKA